jgi:hypothetical protein
MVNLIDENDQETKNDKSSWKKFLKTFTALKTCVDSQDSHINRTILQAMITQDQMKSIF